MNKSRRILLVLTLTGAAMTSPAHSQIQPGRRLYAITEGTYMEVGGFAGFLIERLPDRFQAYVQLDIPASNGTAAVTIRSQDRRTAAWSLTNGVVAGNVVYFHYLTTHPFTSAPATNDYAVTVSAGCLALEGAMTSEPQCCDIPYFFGYSNVLAIAVPTVSAAMSATSPGGMELSWDSDVNLQYQVQCHSGIATDTWTNLGPPIVDNPGNCRFSDAVPANERQRFYRVLVQQKGR